MAREVQISTRPDFAPGKSGMRTSLCASVLRKIPTPPLRRAAEYLRWFEALAVASAVRARRNFARWREQYGLVRERLAQNSNAAIAARSRPEGKKNGWSGDQP